MKSTVATCLLAATFITLASVIRSAHAADGVYIRAGFLRGTSYRNLDPLQKVGYVVGYVNALLMAPLMGADSTKFEWVEKCFVAEMTDDQLVAILDKWLAAHPERWHEQMNALTYSAFKDSCGR